MNTNSVPTEAISIYNSALEKTNRGDFSTALSEYQKAVKMYPYFIEAYSNMGEIYSIMGDREQAISTYNKALNIEKNHKILLNLGVEYYNSGNYKLALAYFLDSLSAKKDFQEGLYYTGLAYYNLKNYSDAEKYLHRVIASDRKHLKANYLLSHIYYEWKEYARVLECLDAIKEFSDDQGFINKYYGFCCYHLGRYDEAVEYLKDALKLQPEYDKFRTYLESLTYENKIKEVGDLESAISRLEKAMMTDTVQLSDVTRLSMLYVFKGESEKAEEVVVNFKKRYQNRVN